MILTHPLHVMMYVQNLVFEYSIQDYALGGSIMGGSDQRHKDGIADCYIVRVTVSAYRCNTRPYKNVITGRNNAARSPNTASGVVVDDPIY